jgi:hypothetical protein
LIIGKFPYLGHSPGVAERRRFWENSMFDERSRLVTQLVRTQAMLWSAENPIHKERLRALILNIERRIAALDGDRAAVPQPAATPKLGILRR